MFSFHNWDLFSQLVVDRYVGRYLAFFKYQFQFKCALLAWQKLYICIAKAIADGLLTSSAHLN